MRHRAARLATAVVLALALRAAEGQQIAPNGTARSDSYPPQFQPSSYSPPQYPSPSADSRYPLAPAYTPPPPVAAASPQAMAAPTESNATLRYPLPQPATEVAQRPVSVVPADNRAASGAPAAAPRGDIFKPGEIVARVGDTAIFYGDVAPLVNQIIDSELSKAKTPEQRRQVEEQIEASREALTRNVVGKLVEIKLKYLEFEREIRKNISDTKKRAEQLKRIDQSVRQQFEQHLAETRTKVTGANAEQLYELVRRDFIIPRLAILMRDYHLESLGELDALLRRYGTTLDKQVRLYGEDQLGQSIVGKHVNKNHEATHEEMLNYYREHASQYAIPAKARFEILTAKFTNYRDRQAAQDAIAEMGNAVFYGTEFAAVARKSSQEPHAANGGLYDWVTQGSLASDPIDRAIFTLEVGKLSQIIEDDVGYHIIRVKEREAAGQVSFLDAQDKIKDAIKLQKRIGDVKKYLETLHARTAVWTIYDTPAIAQQPEQTMRR